MEDVVNDLNIFGRIAYLFLDKSAMPPSASGIGPPVHSEAYCRRGAKEGASGGYCASNLTS